MDQIRLYWHNAGWPQKIVLVTYAALVIINALVTGYGLILGVIAASIGLTIVALIWSGVAKLWWRLRKP